MLCVVCQLLRLFAVEKDGDAILNLQIMKVFPGEHYPGPYEFSPLSGTLAPVSGNSSRPLLGPGISGVKY